jgi:hypothetical protein
MKILFTPIKVPCALMEKCFTIMNIGITKFQWNTVKPCPCLKWQIKIWHLGVPNGMISIINIILKYVTELGKCKPQTKVNLPA